ncbi:hypothetical protein N6H18_01510 [Reichenbachiella agarivorans]|uniref:Uncharacterized protein n=1 Tax=Reichenbachiella agarivorans TaxID=2979464 RepID=A0ABY6CQ50_9BACT|nr:hypothetical protein [Reichenbachiella agarivorans]UXP32645.1 hypothetical protein N6H18_01510 [Reichenbachiella agarivorans]
MKEHNSLSERDESFDQMDQWMKQLPIETVTDDFTNRVVSAAVLRKKRKTNLRILIVMLILLVFTMGLCVFMLGGTAVDNPTSYLDMTRNWVKPYFSGLVGIVSVEIFLMIEGVLFLLVLEKVVSRLILSRQMDLMKK